MIPTLDDEARYSIGQVAEAFQISPRMLRHFEQMGLLSPAREGRTRVYRREDRRRLATILRAQKLGFTLDEIRDLMRRKMLDERGLLDGSGPVIDRQIEHLTRQLREVEAALDELARIRADLAGCR